MGKLEKQLLEELSRFNQIKHNSENLEEQMVGAIASLGMGSKVDELLEKAKKLEELETLGEQEDAELPDEGEEVADAEADATPPDLEGGDEIDADIADIDVDVTDVGDETDIEPMGGEEGTEELDVTDLVTKQEEVGDELADQKDILSKNTESLDDLMNKLSDLETQLSSMEDVANKISSLEDKLEEYRPRTPEEQIGLRKHDSGPFNKTLSDFFTDKEEVFDKTGKKQYILTPEDVEDYSEQDIQKSFDAEDED
jgi:DNA repair exonuclease SbcCD ATPase subunit